MEKEKYYVYDTDGDVPFMEFDTAKEVEDYILDVANDVGFDISEKELKDGITVIKGKEVKFEAKSIIKQVNLDG